MTLENRLRRMVRRMIKESRPENSLHNPGKDRDKNSAFSRGGSESEYTIDDCIKEIKWLANKKDFSGVIYFAELAEKLGK